MGGGNQYQYYAVGNRKLLENGGDQKTVLPLFAWFLIFLVPVLIVVVVFACYKGKLKLTQILANIEAACPFSNTYLDVPVSDVIISYKEIEEATNNFSNQIGSGGFGVVYKGTFAFDNSEVAVKKINTKGLENGCVAEITAMSLINHVHLVKLRGFCKRGLEHFLVFEYMNRGSLDRLLFDSETILNWSERVEIALGTARGLAYLHEGSANKILHLDVKPANILLGDNLQVKIGDFGLSKLLGPEQTKLFMTLRGTHGYLAPEWLINNAGITDKSDVYSYGMVLLEIIRGSRNSSIVKGENGEPRWLYFPRLALAMYKRGQFLELADPRLEDQVNYEQLEMLIKLALCCLHKDPQLRPSMTNVVRMIEGKMAVGIPQVNSLKFLDLYGHGSVEDNMTETTTATTTTTTQDTKPVFSYISSEQVSGPR
ncbi:hypothetical protein AQUCO_01500074v1 [Aquilegia coerulea]|uniref:Protein kinase domain-containing protein n=1 Tax=Aquilegia coerulea TaxID=218851 RepID=A0A2G5DS95_AQUCA|nr:hypothetical protein AQUCO_01500074v1 [Aquilegia coerulea]